MQEKIANFLERVERILKPFRLFFWGIIIWIVFAMAMCPEGFEALEKTVPAP